MASGYKITVYVDSMGGDGSSIGHAFVKLETPDGQTITTGYYPANGFISGPGVLLDDAFSWGTRTNPQPHPSDWSRTFDVSQEQFHAAAKYAADMANNLGDKYRLGTNQCTGFARDLLKKASVQAPGIVQPGADPIPESLTWQYGDAPTNQDNASTPTHSPTDIQGELDRLRQGINDGEALKDRLLPEAPGPYGVPDPWGLPGMMDYEGWLQGFGEGEKRTTSPIILDLDGDGVETAAVTAGAYFDHAADGFAEQTGWVGGGDGLLVRDIDGDGRIDSGRELFGNETLLADGVTKAANGFAALAVLDSNTDGKVDANDAAWQELKVWIDADGDGYSQTDELFTLEQVGVASVNTGFTTSTTVDANGNAHKQIGSFTRSDGTIAAAEDVWFASNPTFSFAEEWVTVSPEIAVLPDAKGYGKVYDLHQAMARDTSGHLQTLVSSYIAATDNATRVSLVELILYAWTGTEAVSTTGRGSFDGRNLAALESFVGRGFVGYGSSPNPNYVAARGPEESLYSWE